MPKETRRRSYVAGLVIALSLTVLFGSCTIDGRQRISRPEDHPTRQTTTSTTAMVAPLETMSTTVVTTTTTEPPSPPIRDVDLRSVTIDLPCVDWEGSRSVFLDRSPLTDDGLGQLDGLEILYRDVTGDGEEDAVIWVSCASSSGGNATTPSVLVVRSDPDGPRQLGKAVHGQSPSIHGRQIVIHRGVWEDGDPRCCPSTTQFVPLRVVDGNLVEGGGGTPVTESTRATTDGLGALAIGRSYEAIAAASGQSVALSIDPEINGDCGYVSLVDGPSSIGGLGTPTQLKSLNFFDGSMKTKSGFGIGSPTSELLRTFDGSLTAQPNHYTDEITEFVLTDRSNGNIAVFGATVDAVEYFGVGVRGWADAPEGCV